MFPIAISERVSELGQLLPCLYACIATMNRVVSLAFHRNENSQRGGEHMKYGLFGINMNVCSNPEVAARVAKAAEAAGFESVWTGEHVVLPDPQVPPSPLPPSYPLLDPAVSLAYIAAHTTAIRLGT